MNLREFRLETVFWVDKGSCMSVLVKAIGTEPSCDLSPVEIEAGIETMIEKGLLMRHSTDWIKVSKSGWELWATRDTTPSNP